jgi:hypothetical protein
MAALIATSPFVDLMLLQVAVLKELVLLER